MENNRIQFDMVTNVQQTLQAFVKVREEAAKLRAEMKNMSINIDINKSINTVENSLINVERQTRSTSNAFQRMGQNMKQHLAWAAGSAILGGLIGVTYAIQNIAKETEALTAKQRQNLELADKYRNNSQLLEQDLKRMNDIIAIYAVGYGESLTNVGDAAQLILRRFKDVDQASYILSAALTMAKIDNVDLMTSTQNLESVMLQFQLDLDGTRKFVNSFTTAVHTSKITGQELLEALQRSGGSFKQFNMGVDESIAAVAALATETSRTGRTIGNTYKSVAANFSMPKAIEALDAYGIKLYEVNENGIKVQRKGANVFQELQTLFGRLDAEGQAKLALAISGGKYQVNAMLSFLQDANGTFSQILNEIQTKSSDALTAQLLRMGLQTYQIKLMQLQASLQVFGKTIGDTVLSELKNMIDGLTNGIVWLTENKEAVSKTVIALVELGKAVTAFYLSQKIANVAIKEGTVLLRLMYMMEGDFKSAFFGMGSAVKTFGAIVATTTLQMAALYAAINVISAAYDRLSDKSGLTGQQQDLSSQIAMIEGNRKFAIANKTRTGMSEDEINAIYDSQITDLKAKLNTVNEQRQAKENEATNKAAAEAERAFKAIVDRAMAAAQVKIPDLSNKIEDKQKGAKGRATAPDSENQLLLMDDRRSIDNMLKEAKIATEQYDAKLQLLNARQQIFGTTTETTAAKIALMHQRIGDLAGSAMEYTGLADEFSQKANDMVAGSDELKAALDAQRLSWKNLSTDEKKTVAEQYKSFVSDYKLLTKYLELADKLKVASAEASTNAGKLGIDSVNTAANDAKTIYDTQMRISGYNQERDIFGLGRFATEQAKAKVNLAYATEQLAIAEERLRKLKDNPNQTEEDLKRQQAEVDKLTAKVNELKDTWYDVRQGLAGITSEVLTQGSTLKNVWNNLWNSLANDAIKALFRVQNSTPGLLSNILGLFGGRSKAVPPIGKNAQGSIGNQEQLSWIREGNKREAIIPLEDYKERGRSLWTQAGVELGMFKGTEVVPYMKNPELVKQSSVNVQVQQSERYIQELERQNQLMVTQNQMIFEMLSSNGGKNGGTVVQPIVMQQKMSEDELANMIYKMRSRNYPGI